jgi:hypothetical protein
MKAVEYKVGCGGRNRLPQASFLVQKRLILRMSQALQGHYPPQHFSNTFADVFGDTWSGILSG